MRAFLVASRRVAGLPWYHRGTRASLDPTPSTSLARPCWGWRVVLHCCSARSPASTSLGVLRRAGSLQAFATRYFGREGHPRFGSETIRRHDAHANCPSIDDIDVGQKSLRRQSHIGITNDQGRAAERQIAHAAERAGSLGTATRAPCPQPASSPANSPTGLA